MTYSFEWVMTIKDFDLMVVIENEGSRVVLDIDELLPYGNEIEISNALGCNISEKELLKIVKEYNALPNAAFNLPEWIMNWVLYGTTVGPYDNEPWIVDNSFSAIYHG